jgi:hypothetical protein
MPQPDALAAALLQLSDHAARLRELDQREADHATEDADRIARLKRSDLLLCHWRRPLKRR